MELKLRSTRSRSKTPFTQIESFDKELIEKGNHVEKTVLRSTRRTTVYRVNESATSSTDDVTSVNVKPSRRSIRSENIISNLYKTSDYSSEEGENEVSSTKTISQNEKNQLIEDARAAANGNSEVSALNLYKKSGRYWDLYPKTDWTYSPHSKDRVELAPGVVAMPNMSRKTIRSLYESDSNSAFSSYAHKETNTDSYSHKENSFTTTAEPIAKYQPRQLFNNNYYNEYEKKTYIKTTRWSRFTQSIITVFTSIMSIFYYTFEVQTRWLAKLYWFTSRVMLLDTWLLRKSNTGNKSAKLVVLCLVPLLFLGGWWILSTLGGLLYGTYFNSTLVTSPVLENSVPTEDISIGLLKQSNEVKINPAEILIDQSKSQVSDIHIKTDMEEKIEQIHKYMEHQNSKQDLEEFSTDNVVSKILANPDFQTFIHNYYKNEIFNELKDKSFDMINSQQKIIDNLRDEIHNIKLIVAQSEENRKEEIDSILTHLKSDYAKQSTYLTYQLNRCCRKPIINIETYVSRILTNLLNDGQYLQSQKGLADYLHTIFVAKQDLESQLLNLTRNLNTKFDDLLEDNSRVIMDKIEGRIKFELKEKLDRANNDIYSSQNTRVDLNTISNERVKQIIKETLAIYDADKTGLVDYAMETMGGQVLTTRCTENYHYGKAVVSVLGIPLWYPVNSPRTIITPSINPGECWAFQNFPGFAVIKLSNHVKIEAFSMEHISKLLVPNGKIDSAPKEFEVYGLSSENDKEPVKLGEYVYDFNGEPLQFFEVQNKGHIFDIIEIRIVSNHGNPNYTCLYRFRVHGNISQESS